MKKCIVIVIVVAVVCIVGTLLVQQFLLGPKKISAAEKTSFDQVTAKLDEGGDFYMYLNAEKIIQGIDKLIASLKELALLEASKNPEARGKIELGFNLLSRILNQSGLFEISGIGISSVAMDNGFNHDTAVIHHHKDKGEGLIWHVGGEKPHALDSLKLLPANTVLARFSDSNLKYLWVWINKEAGASGIPALVQGIKQVKPMLQSKGIDLDKLLDSLGGHNGIILTLDEAKQCQIPIKNFTLEIPDPALAIVIYVKDDALFSLAQKFIPVPPQEEGGVKKIMGPVMPLPITLQPMLVYKDNLLIMASNGKILDEILAGQKGGQGLLDTEEFKTLSAQMPDEGNNFTFLSARLFKKFFEVQKKVMAMSGAENKEAMAAFERLNLIPKDLAIYTVTQNTSEGFVVKSNNNLGIGGFVLLPAIATAGVVAAVAIPNLLTAMQKGKQKSTMGDMKAISVALESYIVDNGRVPKGSSLAEIQKDLQPFYIKMLPLKDGWGHDLLYTSTGKSSYSIASPGKDGVFNGWNQAGFYPMTGIEGFANDIILANGQFVYGPMIK